MNQYLKCRWCPWRTLTWRRMKGRKKATHGFSRLVFHVSYRHEEEYAEIEKLLNEEFGVKA